MAFLFKTASFRSVAAFIAAMTLVTTFGFLPFSASAAACVTGDLIKGSGSAVYYCDADGKRLAFSDSRTFFTWYADFSRVKTISDGELSAIPFGGLVTMRPGVKMVKIVSDTKVYAVGRGGVLRWIKTEEMARTIFGKDWNRQVVDLPVSLFVNYKVGAPIEAPGQYFWSKEQESSPTIAVEKARKAAVTESDLARVVQPEVDSSLPKPVAREEVKEKQDSVTKPLPEPEKKLPTETAKPGVVSKFPAPNAVNVPLSSNITITFNMDMDPASIGGGTYWLRNNKYAFTAPPIPVALSYADRVATLDPNGLLEPGNTYTVYLSRWIKDLKGNQLSSDTNWSFTTASIAPVVVSTEPGSGSVGLGVNENVRAHFDRIMDYTTVNANSFTLKKGAVPVAGSVWFEQANNTVVFDPQSPLEYGTNYTATLTTGIKDLNNIALASDFNWSFATAPFVKPSISAKWPGENASITETLPIIKIDFNKDIDKVSINGNTFILWGPDGRVPGTIGYSSRTATFTVSQNLVRGQNYRFEANTGIKDPDGNSLDQKHEWTFSVSAFPTVTSVTPVKDATEVDVDTKILAQFSMDMEASSINTNTFIVYDPSGLPISGTVSYVADMKTAVFTPSALLKPNTKYRPRLTTGAKGQSGNFLASTHDSAFTTSLPKVIAMAPGASATGVPLSSNITIAFNMDMDPASINENTFRIWTGTNNLPGKVTYANRVATLDLDKDLVPGESYSPLIGGIRAYDGTVLTPPGPWTFTADRVPPAVVSTDPAPASQAVPLANRWITAQFDREMDASTINASTFVLKKGGSALSGTVYHVPGGKAVFYANDPLVPNTVYEATVTTGMKDKKGIAAGSNYVWFFTTANN